MATNYKNIRSAGNANRQGGLQQKVFICPYEDFLVLQDAVDGKVTTAHTVIPTGGFMEVYITKDTGEVQFSPIGGPDRHSYLAKIKLYHPGESDDIVSNTNKFKNGRYVVLCPLPGSTELIQVGTKEFQVELKPSYDTTKNSGDGRGFMIEGECFMPDFIKYTAATIAMRPDA